VLAPAPGSTSSPGARGGRTGRSTPPSLSSRASSPAAPLAPSTAASTTLTTSQVACSAAAAMSVLCTPHALVSWRRNRLAGLPVPHRLGTVAARVRACPTRPLLSVASFGKLRELTGCFFWGVSRAASLRSCECHPVTSVGWIGRLLVTRVSRDHRLVVILEILWSQNSASSCFGDSTKAQSFVEPKAI
jgi:hypothetical protein